MAAGKDVFGSRALLEGVSQAVYLYRLDVLEKNGLGPVSRLPFTSGSIRATAATPASTDLRTPPAC